MNLKIIPKKPSGTVEVISSKSAVHRLLIAAALADRATKISLHGLCDDILATVDCLRELGAEIAVEKDSLTVIPVRIRKEAVRLNCRESGSTLRFLLPVAAALYDSFEMSGTGRLPERPNGPLIAAMRENGVSFSSESVPLAASGKLSGGKFRVRGDISSQFLTGLLLALPLLSEGSTIELTTPLESAGYVDMTLAAMKTFGAEVECVDHIYRISGKSGYRSPGSVSAEGDESAAAFFYAANYLGAGFDIRGLSSATLQGDRKFREIIKTLTSDAAVIDGSEIPDLIPPLAVCSCAVKGTIRIEKIGRLRYKESDRIKSTCAMIRSLGGKCEAGDDFLVINGTGVLRGGTVDSFGDHRIVMSAAVASCICGEPVLILGAEAVSKSYPEFFEIWNERGGEVHVVDIRK